MQIRLQRQALAAGHAAYKERLEELQTLKLHLKNATREVCTCPTQLIHLHLWQAACWPSPVSKCLCISPNRAVRRAGAVSAQRVPATHLFCNVLTGHSMPVGLL